MISFFWKDIAKVTKLKVYGIRTSGHRFFKRFLVLLKTEDPKLETKSSQLISEKLNSSGCVVGSGGGLVVGLDDVCLVG